MVESSERRAIAEARVGKPFAHKYRLKRLVGLGGMAAVYEATHRNGKRVALKLMHSRFGDSERQRKRFLREAYVANSIEHPGVVQVFDDGIDDSGAPYLVMELLGGETLAGLRKRSGGKVELDLVLYIADQLLDVLAVAHARGVIHRDIKPENLFWESSSRLRVLDFGVARSFEHIPGSTVDTQASVLGTPAFMPPEQARGHWKDVDPTSDLWAVGATLFNLVTGQFVHGDGTPNEQLGRAMSLQARSLRDLAPDLPPAFIDAVDRALRYEQKERWPDARSMQRALSELRGSDTIGTATVELSLEPWAKTSSSFHAATETASFAASLAARSWRRHTRLLPLTLLALVIAIVGLRAAMPTLFARGPSARLDGRAGPGIGSAVTAALGTAGRNTSTPEAPTTSTEGDPVPLKTAMQAEPQSPRPVAAGQKSHALRSARAPTATPRASADPEQPRKAPPADQTHEPAPTGPEFLDSRF
jgi:serine/threonine-protein kinase